MSKRYHDSEPAWLGIQSTSKVPPVLRVRPNPVRDEAVLDLNGALLPDKLIWWDAQGRVVAIAAVRLRGPSVLVERRGLATGVYVLEARRQGTSLGRAQVILD